MDITIESGIGHMRLADLKSIHIRDVEIKRTTVKNVYDFKETAAPPIKNT